MTPTATELTSLEEKEASASPQSSVIEIVDYAEKALTEPPRHDLPRSKKLRIIFAAVNVTVALLFIAYKAAPILPYMTPASAQRMLLYAFFGQSAELSAAPSDDGGKSELLPPLSSISGDSSPLDSFDDDELRSILYASETPNCGEGEHPIKPVDLSVSAEHGLLASNETKYELDLASYLDVELDIPSVEALAERYGSEAPVVLIVHTHGTESYADENADTYSDKDNCRSSDTNKNVVAVGAVMAEYFHSVGISTLHCTEMFDADSYIEAYDRSAAAIREFTAIYPSIQYVFDVHRDSVINSELVKLRPVTVIDGELTAQYMCVVGTDERTGTHSGWRTNLAFACQLQARLFEKSDSLVRKMSIRSAAYNQRWAPGSLLLEVGSCGNTLSEAKACAKTIAEQIASIVLEQ